MRPLGLNEDSLRERFDEDDLADVRAFKERMYAQGLRAHDQAAWGKPEAPADDEVS